MSPRALQEEIEDAKCAVATAQNQLDNAATPDFEEVAWKRLDAAQSWLNALYVVAKREGVTV